MGTPTTPSAADVGAAGTGTTGADGTSAPAAALWWREASGSLADLGVLIPIAVALIVGNGLSPTAVLLPAGVLYLVVARVYGVPVAVQPLKAFGAVAIAAGAGSDVIAAGSLLMGAVFLLLGSGGWLDRVAGWFPQPVVRGIQLSVGLIFAKIAWGMVSAPQPAFTDQWVQPWLAAGAVALFVLLLWLRGRILVVAVVAGLAAALAAVLTSTLTATTGGPGWGWGPSPLSLPGLSLPAVTTAAVLLVLPQLPLTFANSCLAPADAAATYFGAAADRVRPARLARTLGSANLLAGAISGMPVCHGAGGMSAHYAFGARTWRAPAMIGATLVVLALSLGSVLAVVLPSFPLALLAAMLAVAGVIHMRLLRDLRGRLAWSVALGVGVLGAAVNLGIAVLAGLAGWWLLGWAAARRSRPVASGDDTTRVTTAKDPIPVRTAEKRGGAA